MCYVEVMTITASEARAKLFPLIQQVNDDSTPIRITSKAGNAVLISESEYESLMETLYLMSNPTNYKVMMESLADARSGNSEVIEFPFTASRKPVKAKKKISASARRKPAKSVTTKKVSK